MLPADQADVIVVNTCSFIHPATPRHHAYIKIAEGCDHSCTSAII